MRCTRRRLLRGASSSLLLPIAGCTGDTEVFFWDNSISVLVGNDSNSQHTVTVTISRGNVVLYTASVIVDAAGRKLVPDAFEVPNYGEAYEVAVGVDAETAYTQSVMIEEGDDDISIFFEDDAVNISSAKAA